MLRENTSTINLLCGEKFNTNITRENLITQGKKDEKEIEINNINISNIKHSGRA